jgi:hypothetical protein
MQKKVMATEAHGKTRKKINPVYLMARLLMPECPCASCMLRKIFFIYPGGQLELSWFSFSVFTLLCPDLFSQRQILPGAGKPGY